MSDGFEKMGATALAIDLRVRLLEVLVGLDTPMARMDKMKKSISRRAHDVVEEVYQALDAAGLEAVKRFLEGYDLNAPLLVPQLTASTQMALSSSDLVPQAKAILILEAEQDIRNLERELREIDALEKRGVVSAGRLANYQPLKPRLLQLQEDLTAIASSYSSLEKRVESVLSSYDSYVNTVSQLFINWNDAITQAEKAVTMIERERD
ncbi:MAG: hypothetical protein CYPHOPRED_005119 [Cyphobasidiales sp. Tagirdzhanova-0007]|nr:MAG: hypothetical protein CYPHOPRED_005119 [Cyphobasidiales sp. Tagirdzhanova-0007]